LKKERGFVMAKMTIAFGVMLVLLGGVSFIATGSMYPTALIPVWVGLVLCLSGVLANTDNSKKRMLWMHIAVLVGLLGFLGAAARAIMGYVKANGGPLAHPIAVEEQAAMAVLCAIFVGLCVRSFIAARRGRIAAA
jgi:hypothetical protein